MAGTPIVGPRPQLVMVAGPNGSGKSTLIAALRADPLARLPPLYINADDLQREHGWADAREAQRLATEMRAEALASMTDVMYETVMSHPSKLAELQRARAAGFQITVHLVATDNPFINEQRVEARVKAGGHAVAPDLIRARYVRTLALAPLAVAFADQALVWDNTLGGDTGGGLALQAVQQGGHTSVLVDPSAGWVRELAARANDRAVAIERQMHMAAEQGLLLEPADLSEGDTTGPLLAIDEHLVVQLDTGTRTKLVHDRGLFGLGEAGSRDDAPVLGRSCRIRYRHGVAQLHHPKAL